MASIILKKRKLCEALEDGQQLKPTSFEVKKRIDENGEYRILYESILPNLKALFPEVHDSVLTETLKANKNDIVSTIECLKYKKPQSPKRTPEDGTFDPTVVSALDQLTRVNNQYHAYSVLAEFKKQVGAEADKTKMRTDAENILLRKVFKIQRSIIIREMAKRQEGEKAAEGIAEELEKTKAVNVWLAQKLEQLEKSQMQSLWNDHIC